MSTAVEKIHQTSSPYLFSDEEKAENRKSISSLDSKFDVKRNSYHGSHYIAISPDGTQIVTLNTQTYQLKLCKSDNLSKLFTLSYDSFRHADVPSVRLNWSLAVSNEITLADGSVDVLVAVSCFTDNDVMKNFNDSLEETMDDEVGAVNPSTWIISFAKQSRISTSIDNRVGIVKFLDDTSVAEMTKMVLVNLYGITKLFIEHETLRGVNSDGFFSFLFSDKSVETYKFPEKLSVDEICSSLLQRNLLKDWFVVEYYKNKIQTVELYNLKSNLLEKTFQKSEESAALVEGKGSPCFAISTNKSLFAYCRGASSITIYLMENCLEVTTKKFSGRNVRILFFDFIQDDNQLLIVAEEESFDEDAAEKILTPYFVVWDLFSSSDNCIRRIKDIHSLFPTKSQRLANSSGNIFTVTETGNIISILGESEISKLLNPISDEKKAISLNNILDSSSSITASTNTAHSVYDSSGNLLSKSERVIVKNPEPWVHNKNYPRTSVFLDDDKSIQLIIGESTVQVWHKKSSSTKVLKYVWANIDDVKPEKLRQMQIESLEVGNKEFSLTLLIPSGVSPQFGRKVKLEWPEKVGVLVDACQALEFFDNKKNEPSDPKKQHEFEDLVQRTGSIVKKYYTKKCGLWRMLDIRYDIMANLIRGKCVNIIKSVLSFGPFGDNKHLHIPRCYSWNGVVKKTDLEIAIELTDGSYRKDTIVVKYLLDYYSDNAINTSSWMFTVSKAIPLLYDYDLDFYVRELFQKPCFGTTEVYLEKSDIEKHIYRHDHKEIRSLNINLGLVKHTKRSFLQKSISQGKKSGKRMISNVSNVIIKKSTGPSLISQVYMVPLPDFTVYPKEINDKREAYWKIPFKLLKLLFWPRGHILYDKENLSPFLKMIRKDNSAEIYDNPSMAAVIEFKWSAARNHFLRHAAIYVVFALIYAVLSDAIKGAGDKITEKVKSENSIAAISIVLVVLFYWLGFYLLNTERIQLKYDKWKRYLSLYNFFDVISVALPMAVYSTSIYLLFKADSLETEEQLNDFIGQYRVYKIFSSFTVLIMWFELFLLLRYFERTGAYIYIIINILKQIMPFLIFILMIVFGFGHAMFVLLNDTETLNLDPNGSTYQIFDDNNGSTPTDPYPYLINQKLDRNSKSDNFYSDFIASVEAVFFWTSGRWDQLDQWDFWPVDVYSILGSILLVTILQNMLIAIMTGAYDDAKEIGRHAVLKYRAELIEDYETIEKPFGNRKGNPRYIYFVGKSDYMEDWLKKSDEARKDHKNYLDEVYKGERFDYDDDDDDDNENINYTVDSDAIDSPREIPLSLYWFVEEDDEKSSTGKARQDNETKTLQNKIQSMEREFSEKLNSMEENIKQLVTLLRNK